MGYSTQQFMDNVRTQKFGNFSDWREKGKTVGWIHPDGFVERQLHNMVIFETTDKQGKPILRATRFTCTGRSCPFCALVEYSKDLVTGIEDSAFDPVILSARVPPKDRNSKEISISYSLRELSGGGDWKRRMGARSEFIFGWVPRDGRKSDSPIELMNVTTSLAQAIKRVIQSQIEDRGEERGDPLRSPYAFKFIYNEDASPGQMYAAERVDTDLAPIDEEVERLLDMALDKQGIDLDRLAKLSDPREMLDAIEYCWQNEDYPFSSFFKFYRSVFEDTAAPRDGDIPDKEVDEVPEDAPTSRPSSSARRREPEPEPRRESRREPEPQRESRYRKQETKPVEEELPVEEEKPRRRAAEPPKEEFSRRIPKADKEPEPSRSSIRREAAQREEPAPTFGRKRAEPEQKAAEPKGSLIECTECGNKVYPNRYGKCPECAAELDVPY